jgi:hypothetical protein
MVFLRWKRGEQQARSRGVLCNKLCFPSVSEEQRLFSGKWKRRHKQKKRRKWQRVDMNGWTDKQMRVPEARRR